MSVKKLLGAAAWKGLLLAVVTLLLLLAAAAVFGTVWGLSHSLAAAGPMG